MRKLLARLWRPRRRTHPDPAAEVTRLTAERDELCNQAWSWAQACEDYAQAYNNILEALGTYRLTIARRDKEIEALRSQLDADRVDPYSHPILAELLGDRGVSGPLAWHAAPATPAPAPPPRPPPTPRRRTGKRPR